MWLASRRSSFRHEDVVVALAACASGGLPAGQAGRWAEQFCQAAIPVESGPTAGRRWTTVTAQAGDRRLVEMVERRRTQGRGPTEAVGRAPRSSPEVARAEARPAARQLLSNPGSVHILVAPPGWTNLLAHAALLERAAPVWRESGLRAAVATSGTQAEIRWQTLTGIAPHRSGTSPDVLIVDHADRRSTADLLRLLAGLHHTGRAILVEGGTYPRVSWRHSEGLSWLGDHLGRLDPGPAPIWVEGVDAAVAPTDAGGVPQRGRSRRRPAGAVGVGPGSRDDRTGRAGLSEVDGLNRAARAVLARRGDLSGPELNCSGRVFQAGDQVIALRRLSGDLPPGSLLQIVAVDPRRSTLTVSGERIRVDVDHRAGRHLGYRYAVTPAVAARLSAPLLVLGPPGALGRHQERVMAAAVTAPAPGLALERFAAGRELPGRGIEWDRRP